jgi:hypothetical protein
VLIETLSFAGEGGQRSVATIEHDAGHFLFAQEKLDEPGIAVVQEPLAGSSDTARESYGRVMGWIEDTKEVSIVPAGDVDALLHQLVSSGVSIG